jgi:hypothetical protein
MINLMLLFTVEHEEGRTGPWELAIDANVNLPVFFGFVGTI